MLKINDLRARTHGILLTHGSQWHHFSVPQHNTIFKLAAGFHPRFSHASAMEKQNQCTVYIHDRNSWYKTNRETTDIQNYIISTSNK